METKKNHPSPFTFYINTTLSKQIHIKLPPTSLNWYKYIDRQHRDSSNQKLKTHLLLDQTLRMPRQLPFNSLATAAAESNAGLGAAAAFLLLCAFTVMACDSHTRERQWLTAAGRWRKSDPVISIHQVQPGAEEGHGEICVWQKGILMGEKCQLPDFSGVITYDSAGNLIAPGRPRLVNSGK